MESPTKDCPTNETTASTSLEKGADANSKKVTRIKYSDRNPSFFDHQSIEVKLNDEEIQCKQPLQTMTYLDDDYALSNELNEIVASNSAELHYFVFQNDIESVRNYIKRHKKEHPLQLKYYLSIRDKHGNTPMHLAAMLGHIDVIKLLIENGAFVKARNKQLWTPLNEAISYGNRELIRNILKKFEAEIKTIMNESKPKINHALKEMKDFYVEIKWDFECWIPFVSRFLPSDVCKLYKHGTKIRIDCTLGDLLQNSAKNENGLGASASSSPFSWQRGDLTFLFDVELIGEKNAEKKKNSVLFLNNKKKTFMRIDKQSQEFSLELDIEKEIDLLLSKEMLFLKLDTKQAQFIPTQTGWFSKRDKIETVNGYNCQFYDINNLFIVSKVRSEHLSEEELRKNEEKHKKLKEKLMKRSEKSEEFDEISELDEEIEHRPDLTPPDKPKVVWSDYINSPDGQWPCLSRPIRCKESKKEFRAQLAISQDFPLSIKDFNSLLDALTPLAKFRKLKEFINLRLPVGFPLKIDIPIVPSITAKVSFQNFKNDVEFSEDLFKIPDDYVEHVQEASI